MFKLEIPSNVELRKVLVKECDEDLVDMRKVCPEIAFIISDYIKSQGEKAHEDAYFVRLDIAHRLNQAQSLLPSGLQLAIRCGYRSPKLQAKVFQKNYEALQEEHPDWTHEQLEAEMEKRVAPVDIAPHCTGAAVDLTIIDSNGKQLDMGTNFSEFTEETYTDFPGITEIAKENRDILKAAMFEAGFLNFPAEWWHWSYGDRDWALMSGAPYAIYNQVER